MCRVTTIQRWSVGPLRSTATSLVWARVAWRVAAVIVGLAVPVEIVEWQAALLGAAGMAPCIVDIAKLIGAGTHARRAETPQGDKE